MKKTLMLLFIISFLVFGSFVNSNAGNVGGIISNDTISNDSIKISLKQLKELKYQILTFHKMIETKDIIIDDLANENAKNTDKLRIVNMTADSLRFELMLFKITNALSQSTDKTE